VAVKKDGDRRHGGGLFDVAVCANDQILGFKALSEWLLHCESSVVLDFKLPESEGVGEPNELLKFEMEHDVVAVEIGCSRGGLIASTFIRSVSESFLSVKRGR
jgi:hypothetical protein